MAAAWNPKARRLRTTRTVARHLLAAARRAVLREVGQTAGWSTLKVSVPDLPACSGPPAASSATLSRLDVQIGDEAVVIGPFYPWRADLMETQVTASASSVARNGTWRASGRSRSWSVCRERSRSGDILPTGAVQVFVERSGATLIAGRDEAAAGDGWPGDRLTGEEIVAQVQIAFLEVDTAGLDGHNSKQRRCVHSPASRRHPGALTNFGGKAAGRRIRPAPRSGFHEVCGKYSVPPSGPPAGRQHLQWILREQKCSVPSSAINVETRGAL